VFSKEEFLEVVRVVNQEIKRERKAGGAWSEI
jgi:hypothetical protein